MKMENTNRSNPLAAEMHSPLHTGTIQTHQPLKAVPTPLLLGLGGAGKSEAVIQLDRRLKSHSGEPANTADGRLFWFLP